MKLKKRIKNSLIYIFVRFIFLLFNILPRSSGLFLGAKMGELIYSFSEKDRNKAHKTMTLVYGDRFSTYEKEAIIKNFFVNSGKNLADVFRFKNHYKDQIRPLIETEGLEHFDRAYKRGKGVIAITGHLGNFELLAAFTAGEGYKAAAIGREMYDKRLDKLLVENRSAMGVVNVDTNSSPRKIMKLLKDGYALGVLIDIDSMRVRSEFVPAFGHLARTPVGQSILGLKAESAFVPIACVRNGDKYKIVVRPEIIIEPTGDFEKDVYNITARCNEELDILIDSYLDQWAWLHNRWNTRPESENGVKQVGNGDDK